MTVDAEQQQTFELAPSMACRVHVAETTYEFERGDVVSATLLGAYVVQQRPVLTATERAPLNLQGGSTGIARAASAGIARLPRLLLKLSVLAAYARSCCSPAW